MLVEYGGGTRAILRAVDDFGFESYDLVSVPSRLARAQSPSPLVEANIDRRRVTALQSPAQLACARVLDNGDNWLALSTRTLARLYAGFLVAEDPQRRLDARKAATLMHQVSLVQHILERPNLRKVLIGDEVGLGKTIEAGLLMQRLIERNPAIRILYLAPARLVGNVVSELRDKLEINARAWVAGPLGDARLSEDSIVVASIHKAVFGANLSEVAASGPWDVLFVDECHHLSDWDPSGGKPNQSFKLVSQIVKAMTPTGRLVLMSGTPHQGNEARFKNILRLLSDDGKSIEGAAGRVIFRTKDRVRDWKGAPLFPARDVRKPVVVSLGLEYERWYLGIAALYDSEGPNGARARAAGWAKGQALQWAASSVQAGVGFLVRLAMRRLGWSLGNPALSRSIAALRPYRGGSPDEPVAQLFARLARQVGAPAMEEETLEDEEDSEDDWKPDADHLASLLEEGVSLIGTAASQAKWDAMCALIDDADGEKVVLFAQPVETVTVVASVLERRYKQKPALIIGNQGDEERLAEVARFQSDDGPRFLVSSRAGGEGLNMQRARRLIHLDVPWNPMELEQRIGRIHRFGSRKTVIVDSVVARGSREVDMYRVAREKLALIARNLDPEQFDSLFNRVMSLVPPKELESVLSDVTNTLGLDDPAIQQIGKLVTEGFSSWNAFDETYRRQAEQIRATEPGEAHWADVGHFLVKHGGAEEQDDAVFGSFTFKENEIVAIEERVPSIRIAGRQFACGDTGGLRAAAADGSEVHQLGLNIDAVQTVLSQTFSSSRKVGPVFLNRGNDLDFLGSQGETTVALVFLRQKLEQERGIWAERDLTLHCYVLLGDSPEAVELNPQQRAALVRSSHNVSRVKDGGIVRVRSDLEAIEASLFRALKRPTDDQLAAGARYAVWPLAVLVMI
ncbi:MAG: DEAD/DEAH box helicase [Pseudomonadota bacterium]